MKKFLNIAWHRQVNYRWLKSLTMLITLGFYFYVMNFMKHTITAATISLIVCMIQIYLITYVFYLLDQHYK